MLATFPVHTFAEVLATPIAAVKSPHGTPTAKSQSGELPNDPALSSSSAPAPACALVNPSPRVRARMPIHPFTQVAIGVKLDSLGAGFELATPLLQTVNLRAGGNFFQYGYAFPVDGVTYNSALHFSSAQVNLDWFPFHGAFHVSPGFLLFNNRLSANASVPAGKYFKLGGQTFTSSFTDPIHGSAGLKFDRQFAPSLVIGFGNILPRSGRHFSVPFEVGAAYVGQPLISLDLAGTACLSQGCYDVTSDPQTQQSLRTEQNELNKDLTQLEYYPLLSTGFAFRF